MDTLALFGDGSVSRLIFAAFETTLQDDPVRLVFPDIEDAQMRNSARNSCMSVYHLLSSQRYLRQRDRFFYSCQFADTKVNLMAEGKSAGLAFGLKFAQEAYRQNSGKLLAHSIAATGVISDSSREARVESVKEISAKLESAIAVLAAGDQVFFPEANQNELSSALWEQAASKGIQLAPVSSMDQAIAVLFASVEEKRNGSTARRIALATALALPLFVGGYLFYDSLADSTPAIPPTRRERISAQGMALPSGLSLATRLQGHKQISAAIDFLYLGINKRGRVAVNTPSSPLALRYGDMFKLACRVNQPCYLHVYLIDSRGRVDRLPEPTPGMDVPFLKADSTYYLPAEEEGWRLVDAMEGEEVLYIVASRQLDTELEDTYRNFRLAPEVQKQEFTRLLKEQLQARGHTPGVFYTTFKFQHLPNGNVTLANRSPDLLILGRGDTQILFVSDYTGDEEIYVVNTEGTNLNRLTHDSGVDNQVSWSPDGSRIVFVSNRSGDEDIYVMNANGSGVQNLTQSPGRDTQPSWSPDGTQIVFQSNRSGTEEDDFDIYIMDVGSHEVKPLAATPVREQHPVFSPDGKEIAYVYSTTFDDQQIFLMNADGTEKRPLQPSLLPLNEVNPIWSPDGRRLFFTGFVPGVSSQVYHIDVQGTGNWQPTTSLLGNTCLGALSPDGTHLVFYGKEKLVEATYSLYRGDVRGNQRMRLMDHLFFKIEVSWGQSFRNLGTAQMGEQIERQMFVKNIGGDTLKVRQIRFSDKQFSALPEQIEVLPGEIGSVVLSFAPNQEGTSYAELELLSNDPEDPEIRIILNGRGQPAASQVPGTMVPGTMVPGTMVPVSIPLPRGN